MPVNDQLPELNPGEIETVADLAGALRHLRRRLARTRQDAPLTYRELAARTGWAHGVIGDYFAGKTLPPTDRFDVLVRLFGASPVEQGRLATARDRVEEGRRSPAGPVARPSLPAPRELPPDVCGFVGRADELAAMDALVRPTSRPGPVVICAIDGIGGVGKSALAVHAAHRLADRFPDGQLYVDLRGATPSGAPLAPLSALALLLRGLGVAGPNVPDDEAQATAMFRALAAGRRLLVVLDDARDPGQVRPLLPASPTCAVLVTSRQILATLDGAAYLHLDVLPAAEALALLGALVGHQRVADDRPAAAELARLCDHLPLALRIAGARLAARPRWPIGTLAARLADPAHRLDELRHGDLGVRAGFEASHRMLPTGAAAAFARLALLDCADLSLPVAARLLDLPEPEAESTVEHLVDAGLLETAAPGRYRYRELLRLYARESAAGRSTPEDRADAVVRAVAWYAATSVRAARLVWPGEDRPADGGGWDRGGLGFADAAGALDWWERERPNLLAAIAQAADTPGVPAELTVALARTLACFLRLRCRWPEWIGVGTAALALARRIGDRAGEARACLDLGVAHDLCGRYEQAMAHLRPARAIFRETGDLRGEAACVDAIGVVCGNRELDADARSCFEESLDLSREIGDRHLQAVGMTDLAGALSRAGRHEQAAGCCRAALDAFVRSADLPGQVAALNQLAAIHRRRDDHAEALACLARASAIGRRLGDRHALARALLTEARIDVRHRRFDDALNCLGACRSIVDEIGARREEAECLREIGCVLHARGEHRQAADWWRRALVVLDELGVPSADAVRALLALGDPPTGYESAEDRARRAS